MIKGNHFMIFSNIFLVLPVMYASLYHERIYLFLASGVFIFSSLYHWYKIEKSQSKLLFVFEWSDWYFVLAAFLYMYYYIYKYDANEYKIILFALLSFAVLFFWYGRRIDYKRLHPWFHVIGPLISSVILILAH